MTDDRMETITDPAEIRATDDPDERTTPAPVGAAVTLDLDAIEADALAALNPSRCRCTVQSGSVYSSQCPRHDPRDPGYRAPWQMPPATAFALVAEVRRLTEESEARRVREMDAVDLAMSERARALSAEAEVVTLRARLAEGRRIVGMLAETVESECENERDICHEHDRTSDGSCALLADLLRARAALATTGEGQ